jgi:ketosteroid isomerase-like protein
MRSEAYMPEDIRSKNQFDVFEQFVAAINAHDVNAIAALMTADHLFVDSLGNRVQGSATMRSGWAGYFTMCPDYWLKVDKIAVEGGTVLATGEVDGTIDGVTWQTPAAWQAIVRDGLISEWRVFADNKPVYEILARRKP